MFKKILKPFRMVRDAWRAYRTVKKAIDALKKENGMPTSGGVATVPVKSAWLSKINWASVISVVAAVLTYFGLNLDAETQAAILTAITSVTAVIIWVLRTFFNRTVTPE